MFCWCRRHRLRRNEQIDTVDLLSCNSAELELQLRTQVRLVRQLASQVRRPARGKAVEPPGVKERDVVVRIDVEGRGNWRPGVVIRLAPPRVRVAYGGRADPTHPAKALVVTADSRPGRALELRDPTWFQGANASLALPSELRPTGEVCPRELFFEILRLVRDWDAAVEAGR